MVIAKMNSDDAVPYIWSECQPPSDAVLKMWYEVGNKLDKDSTGKESKRWSSEALENLKFVMRVDFCR